MGHAVSGGVADFAAYARTSLDDLARLVELARTANPKATIGLSLYVATGTGPTVDYFRNIFAAGFFIKPRWTRWAGGRGNSGLRTAGSGPHHGVAAHCRISR